MPNVRRLLAAQGTTFADAVDSFPLCCPSRATFITGQYAHNHGVAGNFYPYGWYGMKHRENVLPVWLQRAGYTTALVGKWLNGYGARDAHGEVPAGFDIWRGLLDVSAYDYYNFVMNRNGKLKSWGDAVFARKLVEFANIEVTPNPGGIAGVLAKLQLGLRPGAVPLLGSAASGRLLARRDRAGSPRTSSAAQRTSKKPFFIWWAPAAPHREDVAVTLMGRPGRDPRPAPRYERRSASFTLPMTASFNEADFSDKPSNMQTHAPAADRGPDPAAPARLRGADRLAAGRRRPRQAAREDPDRHQPAQEHATSCSSPTTAGCRASTASPATSTCPTRSRCASRSSCAAPACRPAGPCTARSPTSTSRRRCSTSRGRGRAASRTATSLMPTVRNPRLRPEHRDRDRGAGAAVRGRHPAERVGPAVHAACAPTATRTSCTRRPASRSSTTAAWTRPSCATSPPIPPTRG